MTFSDDATDLVEGGSFTILLSSAGCDLSSNTWEIIPCCLLTCGIFSEESPSLVGGPRLRVDIRGELGDTNGIAW